MIEIILGVGCFTGIVLILVGLILIARANLVATGNVTITVNNKKRFMALNCGLIPSPLCGGRLGWGASCGAWLGS
jgi:Na+-transporting NADH:ubiquinone oxidoreductase subunit F